MFDHVKFGVSDHAASKAFFLKALEPLGVAVVSEVLPNRTDDLDTKHRLFVVRVREARSSPSCLDPSDHLCLSGNPCLVGAVLQASHWACWHGPLDAFSYPQQ